MTQKILSLELLGYCRFCLESPKDGLHSFRTAEFCGTALRDIATQILGSKSSCADAADLICRRCERCLVEAFKAQNRKRKAEIKVGPADAASANLPTQPVMVNGERRKYQSQPPQQQLHQVAAKTGLKWKVKPKYSCNECQSLFSTKHYLKLHLRSKHFPLLMEFTCETCGRCFPNSTKLKLHKKTHLEKIFISGFKCNECFRQFGTKAELQSHLIRLHFLAIRGHLCSVCGEKFPSSFELTIHIRKTHSDSKLFTCEKCPKKSFCSAAALRAHQISHSDERKFSCHYCGSLYKTSSVLNRHIQDMHLIKHFDFQCPVPLCSRTFKNKNQLNLHVNLTHLAEPDHVCEKCGVRFRLKKSLKKHQVEHTGAYQKCEACPKQFRRRDLLKAHILAYHSDKERNFKCSLCPSSFFLPL